VTRVRWDSDPRHFNPCYIDWLRARRSTWLSYEPARMSIGYRYLNETRRCKPIYSRNSLSIRVLYVIQRIYSFFCRSQQQQWSFRLNLSKSKGLQLYAFTFGQNGVVTRSFFAFMSFGYQERKLDTW
jgi:hypothetical protein